MSSLTSNMIMTPGPSEVHPEVLAALSRPQLVHYGSDWGQFYKDTCLSLRDLFGTSEQPLMLFGSGSLVMEMGIANTLKPGDHAINLETGYFGRRWEEVMSLRGIHVHQVAADLGQIVSVEAVDKAFKEQKNAKALVAVHVDTSSGVLSPVDQYAEVAHKHGALVIVDAISSFGGMPLRIDKWGIDFCAGYPSKCLSSISGITPYTVSKRLWEKLDSEEPQAGWYLNLKVIKKFIEDWGSWGHAYPTTIPVQAVVALREAIRVAGREGLEKYYEGQRRAGQAVREAAEAMGLGLLTKGDIAAPVVTPITIGDGLEKKVQAMLLERHKIEVGGGLIAPMIRIGTMGRSAYPQFVLATISALETLLRELGRSIQPGVGLTAAQRHLEGIRR
jgi:alanine-glyoxylate transaminase/serine-glyoxylate transaminase/serine-pyruvate transaminase